MVFITTSERGRYLRTFSVSDQSKPAISTTGFENGQSPKPAISITGNLAERSESKPAISIAGIGAGRRSRCEAFAEVIAAKVEAGLSARRIYQDLVQRTPGVAETGNCMSNWPWDKTGIEAPKIFFSISSALFAARAAIQDRTGREVRVH